MNAPAKTTLSTETVAEWMNREGVESIKDWHPVGVENRWAVHMKDGRVGTGPTIRAAIDTSDHVKVAA